MRQGERSTLQNIDISENIKGNITDIIKGAAVGISDGSFKDTCVLPHGP